MSFSPDERKQQFLAFVEDSQQHGVTREEIRQFLITTFDLDPRGAAAATHKYLQSAIANGVIVEVSDRCYIAQFAPSVRQVARNGSAVDAMVYDDRERPRPIQPTDRFARGKISLVVTLEKVSGVDLQVGGEWLQWYRVREGDVTVQLFMGVELPDLEPGMTFTQKATYYRVWQLSADGKFKVPTTTRVPEGHGVALIVI